MTIHSLFKFLLRRSSVCCHEQIPRRRPTHITQDRIFSIVRGPKNPIRPRRSLTPGATDGGSKRYASSMRYPARNSIDLEAVRARPNLAIRGGAEVDKCRRRRPHFCNDSACNAAYHALGGDKLASARPAFPLKRRQLDSAHCFRNPNELAFPSPESLPKNLAPVLGPIVPH